MQGSRKRFGAVTALAAVIAACNHDSQPDCLSLPCPLPLAITLNVTSAAGGPVAGVALTVAGALTGTGSCTQGNATTTCIVPGASGNYDLRLTAPGFVDKTISVAVTGTTPACGCPKVDPQSLDVVLTPA